MYIMRRLSFIIASVLLAAATSAARAEPQSYCEVYSKDFADIRTSNVDQWQLIYRSAFNDCMVSYNAKPNAEPVSKPVSAAAPVADVPAAAPAAPEADQQAAADTGASGEPVVGPEDPSVMKAKKAKQVATRAKPKPRKVTVQVAPAPARAKPSGKDLVPGSDEWNNYCAAKYSSFNKLNGTYMSNSGKIRRCR